MKSKVNRTIIDMVHQVVDILFIVLMLFLLLLAIYARWDTQQLYTRADPIQYIQYKPSPPEMMPFEVLQEINPEVLGWLTIYGTNIDYPIVQAADNNYYLNHNPKREVEGSGSLFLDYRNNKNFTDFNTIIFGHHMAENKMFGDLDLFLEEEFWNSHEYGNLIYEGQNHGIQFIAMLQCDAYDWTIYKPAVSGEKKRIKYINHIYETAKYVRGIDSKTLQSIQQQITQRSGNNITASRTSPVTPDDHLVLLSTCSSDITNGRYILVCKLLDHSVENPFPDNTNHKTEGIDTAKITDRLGQYTLKTWIFILILLIVLVLLAYIASTYWYKKKLNKENGENTYDQNAEKP